MHSIILIGSRSSKDEYIDKYIRHNNIPSFNIFKYGENLKISDAREVKIILSKASTAGKKRLVLIEQNPNAEAQNALLKTLEELDDDTDFIFAADAELLPTIRSRSRVVNVSDNSISTNLREENLGKTLEIVEKIINANSFVEKELLLENLFLEKTEDTFKYFTFALRKNLIDSISSNNFVKTKQIFQLLKKSSYYYSFVVQNNLNSKLTLEKILLS